MKPENRMHPKLVCKRCGKEINRDNKLNGNKYHGKCMIKIIDRLRNKGEIKNVKN